MASNDRTVDLKVRAKTENLTALQKAAEALERLESSQQDFASATGKATRSLKDLETEFEQINRLGSQLNGLVALRNQLNSQRRVVLDQIEAFRKAREAATDYAKGLGDGAKRSKEQEAEVKRLAQAQEEAETAFKRSLAAYRRLRREANQGGVGGPEGVANLQRQIAAQEKLFDGQKANLQVTKDRLAAEKKVTAEQQRQRQIVKDRIAAERKVTSRFAAFSQRATTITRDAATSRVGSERAQTRANLSRAEADATQRLTEIERKYQEVLARNPKYQRAAAAGSTQVTAARRREIQSQNELVRSAQAFIQGGRTTLSFYQRLRGQILSVAAAYVSFYGVFEQGRQVLQADLARQAAETRLLFANRNNQRRAAEDLKFVREEANRLGQDLTTLATTYSRFRIAGDGINLSLEKQRTLFTQFSEVSTVLGLSADETAGVFRALEQSLSKGAVQAEELRGQLGDRLPGAFTKFAKAIGVSVAELNKLLEAGQVSAETLPLFGELLSDEVAGALPKAVTGLRAELARLKTAYDDFLVTIARSGFSDEIQRLSVQLRTFFRSEEGLRFAEGIGQAFQAASQFLQEFGRTIATVLATWLKLAVALATAKFVAGLIIDIGKLGRLFAFAATQIRTAGVAALFTGRALRLLQASLIPIVGIIAFFGIELLLSGKRAEDASEGLSTYESMLRRLRNATRENIDLARQSADAYIEEQKEVKALAESKLEEAKNRLLAAKAADAEFNARLRATSTFSKGGIEILAAEGSAVSGELRRAQQTYDGLLAIIEDANGKIETATNERDAAIRRSADETNAFVAKKAQEAVEFEKSLNDEQLKNDEAYRAKVNERRRQLYRELQSVDRDALTGANDIAYQAAQAALDSALQREVRSTGLVSVLDNKESTQAAERLADEIKRINEQAAEQAIQIRRSALQQQEDDEKRGLEARLELIRIDYAERIAEQRKYLEEANRLNQSGAAATFGANITALESQRKIALAQEQENSAREAAQQTYEQQKTALDNLIASRDAEIERVNQLKEANLLTNTQAAQEVERITRDYQPRILSGIQAIRDFILANKDVLGKMFNVEEILIELDSLQLRTQTVVTEGQRRAQELREQFSQGASQALSTLGVGLANAIRGFGSLGDAIKGARDAFLNFAADFLVQIGQMILQQAILNALQSAFGGEGGPFGFLGGLLGGKGGSLSVGKAHTGAVVGRGFPQTAKVSPWVFAGAPRYHSGGVVGLAPDEVPAILQRGEEVLSKSDPRNVMNGGGGSTNLQINNYINPDDMAQAVASTPSFKKALFNEIRANRTTYRQALA